MSEEKPKYDLETARQALEQEKRGRESSATADINKALEKYRCRLVPLTMIQDGRIMQEVRIEALP